MNRRTIRKALNKIEIIQKNATTKFLSEKLKLEKLLQNKVIIKESFNAGEDIEDATIVMSQSEELEIIKIIADIDKSFEIYK